MLCFLLLLSRDSTVYPSAKCYNTYQWPCFPLSYVSGCSRTEFARWASHFFTYSFFRWRIMPYAILNNSLSDLMYYSEATISILFTIPAWLEQPPLGGFGPMGLVDWALGVTRSLATLDSRGPLLKGTMSRFQAVRTPLPGMNPCWLSPSDTIRHSTITLLSIWRYTLQTTLGTPRGLQVSPLGIYALWYSILCDLFSTSFRKCRSCCFTNHSGFFLYQLWHTWL